MPATTPLTPAAVALAVVVSTAWFYATTVLCVAAYPGTAALLSTAAVLPSYCLIIHASIGEYQPIQEPRLLEPPRRLIEVGVVAPSVGFVVSTIAVSANGNFIAAFAMLALAAVLMLVVPAHGGDAVTVAVFTTCAWWFAFCFHGAQQYGCTLIAFLAGPPLGLTMCGIARLIVSTMAAVRRLSRRGALAVPPLLMLLVGLPVYKWLAPEKPAKKKAVVETSPEAKTFVTGQHFLKLEATSKLPRTPNGVPLVVHQTWRSHKMRTDHRAFFDSWSRCLPAGWLHVLWTDAEVDSFVRQRAPKAFASTFARYELPIQRVDTFRYVLMLSVGGLYADLDNECFAPPELPGINQTDGCKAYVATQGCTDSFLWNCTADQLGAFRADVHTEDVHTDRAPLVGPLVPVQNSLLASAPGHPFWAAVLDLANQRFATQGATQMSVRRTTGVDLISLANYRWNAAAFNQPSKRVCALSADEWHGGDPEAVKAGRLKPPRYVLHHGTASWATLQSKSQEFCRLLMACPR